MRKQPGTETGGVRLHVLSMVHVMLRGLLRPYVCLYVGLREESVHWTGSQRRERVIVFSRRRVKR